MPIRVLYCDVYVGNKWELSFSKNVIRNAICRSDFQLKEPGSHCIIAVTNAIGLSIGHSAGKVSNDHKYRKKHAEMKCEVND
jgi:hypothetical protein